MQAAEHKWRAIPDHLNIAGAADAGIGQGYHPRSPN